MTEYTLQGNFKVGNHLINVTGIDQHTFQENLKWVTENAAGIISAGVALEAAYGVKELTPHVASTQVTNEAPGQWADRPYSQATPQQYTPQPQQQAQQGPGPACTHGPMKLVPGGVSKNTGKAYNAFYSCTAGRDSGCRSVNT